MAVATSIDSELHYWIFFVCLIYNACTCIQMPGEFNCVHLQNQGQNLTSNYSQLERKHQTLHFCKPNCTLITTRYMYMHISLSLSLSLSLSFLQRILKEKGKIAKEMISFFSHTFGKVTKLDVSKCNLDSDAAEVWYCTL